MKTFEVTLTRTTVSEAIVIVKAADADLAAAVAEKEATKQINGEKSSVPEIDWSDIQDDIVEIVEDPEEIE